MSKLLRICRKHIKRNEKLLALRSDRDILNICGRIILQTYEIFNLKKKKHL